MPCVSYPEHDFFNTLIDHFYQEEPIPTKFGTPPIVVLIPIIKKGDKGSEASLAIISSVVGYI